MMLKKDFFFTPYFVGAVAAIAISFLIIIQYPGFNKDGTLYLHTANYIQQFGFHHVIAVYTWPFYPALIAKASPLFHLSLLNTAYLYNIIFFTISVLAFIKIITQLGANRSIQWLGLVIILFYRPFNKFNYYIVRDNGYWCFMLLSVIILLHFMQHTRWYYGILWSLCVVIATLFRVEGSFFLLFVPFTMFFSQKSWVEKFKAFFTLYVITIIIGLIMLTVLIMHPDLVQHNLGHFVDVTRSLGYGYKVVYDKFLTYSDLMVQYVLPPLSKSNASGLLFSGVLFYTSYLILAAISVPYIIGIFYAWYRRVAFSRNHLCVIFAYILINIIILFCFTYRDLYFVGRYYIFLTLSVLVFAPFGLMRLYRDWQENKGSNGKKILLIISILFFIAMVVSTLFHIGPSKKYIKQGTDWLAANTNKNVLIYSNIGSVGFMADRKTIGWQLNQPTTYTDFDNVNKQVTPKFWQGCQYLVIDMKNSPDNLNALIALVGVQPIKIFKQHRPNRSLVIFKLY